MKQQHTAGANEIMSFYDILLVDIFEGSNASKQVTAAPLNYSVWFELFTLKKEMHFCLVL